MELPRLSMTVIPIRPFIYEVDIQHVPQFNYEYMGYHIGKLKCIHNHPINKDTIYNAYTGRSTWYPSMMVLNRFHNHAKKRKKVFFRCTIITIILLIILIFYIALTSQTDQSISNKPKFYLIIFLLLIEFTTILSYGLYIIYTKFHDKKYIISLTNGTTDETLLKYRKELIHVIDMANIPDHDHTRYQIEKKYQINR
jgi:hypothetical protein